MHNNDKNAKNLDLHKKNVLFLSPSSGSGSVNAFNLDDL